MQCLHPEDRQTSDDMTLISGAKIVICQFMPQEVSSQTALLLETSSS